MLFDTFSTKPLESVPRGLAVPQTQPGVDDKDALAWALMDSKQVPGVLWLEDGSSDQTSDLRREAERLVHALRQHHQFHSLGTLAGGIAHDLNNTLHAVLGYTELVMEDVPHDSLAWQYLRQVMVAGTRAKDMVQYILKASRQQEWTRRPMQLGPVIEEVLLLLQASYPGAVTIRQAVAPQVGAILGDATQMYQVLLNLCLNAVHAMRPQGGILEVGLDTMTITTPSPVQLGTLSPGSYVRLSVRDTGHGIDAETLSHIFEPFFSTKGADEGMGLGLAVVRSIVRQHGGAIQVSSRPDQGSTFTLYFPALAEPFESSLSGNLSEVSPPASCLSS